MQFQLCMIQFFNNFISVLIDSPSKYIIHSIFSDSVSPAFLIRVGASINYSGSGEDESDSKENIYEEIKDKSDDNLDKSSSKDSRKSSSMSQDAETQSQTKSKFQKALEAVTRRSSRSLDVGSEKSFHLSISKGRKKSLIDKAKVDWDCYGPEMERGRDTCLHSKLNKSSSDMLGEVNSSHDRVMSQLKLDVEVSPLCKIRSSSISNSLFLKLYTGLFSVLQERFVVHECNNYFVGKIT